MLDQRHFLAFLTDEARVARVGDVMAALPHTLRKSSFEGKVFRTILLDRLPGIVCRPNQPCDDGEGQIGFSFPIKRGDERVRAAIRVRKAEIARFLSPWAVMEMAQAVQHPVRQQLSAVQKLGKRFGIDVGLIGSAAMAVVTTLPYVGPRSDIDLVVRNVNPDSLEIFFREITLIGLIFGRKFDVEVDVGKSSGVKIEEILSKQRSVLLKKNCGVEIIPREEAMKYMKNNFITMERQ